jgi:hypothetical protein
MCGSEVYDPKSNEWSTLAPMKFARYCHDVAVMGEELVVYGGHTSRILVPRTMSQRPCFCGIPGQNFANVPLTKWDIIGTIVPDFQGSKKLSSGEPKSGINCPFLGQSNTTTPTINHVNKSQIP